MKEIFGSKGGASNTHTAVEYPDTLASNSQIRILTALGEGEFENIAPDELKKRVYLDGTPIANEDGTENFTDVTVEYRPGTPNQEPINGFPAVESETEVGVSLKKTAPWVRNITTTDIDAVRLRLSFQLLTYEDDGDRVGGRVDYRIEYRKIGDSAYTLNGDFSIVGKQSSGVERDHRVDLPASSTGWQVRVTRLTDDSTSTSIINTSKIVAITTILDSRLRYPWTALLFVQFYASAFQNIPKVSIRLKGRKVKVPSNYDPETRKYVGTWNGVFKIAYTNNPAWVVYDMALHKRFGLGRRIPSQFLDKWTMYRIGQRCDDMVPDGMGGTEPRHLCNVYIQKRSAAWTVIRDLVSIYNGMVSYGNQMLQMSVDQPANVVRKTITRDNVIDGKIAYSYGSKNNRKGIAHVSWDNPANHYTTEVAVATEKDLVDRYGVEPLEMSAIGCTRESEAIRRGRWGLLTNILDTTVNFSVGLEGLDFLIGDVIAVSNNAVAGGQFGGRVVSVDGRVVKLDRALDTNVATGDKFIAIPAGKNDAVSVAISAISIDRESVTLATATAFNENTVFVLDCVKISPELFRVTNIKYNESSNSFAVTGLKYNASKFDSIDKGTRLDDKPTTLINTGAVKAPASVTMTGYSSVNQGKRIASAEINWEQVSGAVAYNIQYRRYSMTADTWGNDWVNVPQQSTIGVTLNNVFSGKFQARVCAVGQGGSVSAWTESNVEAIDGKRGTIPKVTGLAGKPMVFGILWSWNATASGTEDMQATHLQYRVLNGSVVSEWYDLGNITYPGATLNQMGLAMGQIVETRARYITSYGDYGEWSDVVRSNASDVVADYYEQLDNAIRDGETYKQLTSDIKAVSDGNKSTASDLAKEQAARIKADADEVTNRSNAINAEATARANAITKEQADRAAGDLAEANARTAAIKAASDKSAADLRAESDARNAAITKEASDRAAAVQKVAADAASALLNEKNERVADISSTQTVVQNNYDSLAQQIAQVSAGTGIQFDSLKIWHFNTDAEGWTSSGGAVAIVDDGWLKPANNAGDCYVTSPTISVDATAYRFVMVRIKRVGNPVWEGDIYWTTTGVAFSSDRRFHHDQPEFDSNGIATLMIQDIPWNTSEQVNKFRLDLTKNQDADNYIQYDWIAVGRPTPGAGQAALEDERTARVNGDAAEATARQTLAVQMRGDYTGTDAAQVKTGLIYSEQQARINGDKVEVAARQALEAKVDAADAAIQKDVSAISTKTDANANDITALKSSVANKAEASALNATNTRVTTAEGKITSQGTAITNLQNSLKTTDDKTNANASAINNMDSRVTSAEGKIASQGAAITTLDNEITTVSRQGMNYWLDGSFESYATGSVASNLSGTGRMLVVDSQKHVGSKSLKLSRIDGEAGNSDKTFGARLPIRAGGSFRIECWVMMPADQTPPTGWKFNLGLWTQTAQGGNGWVTAFSVADSNLTDRDAWVKFSGVVNVASTAATAMLWGSMTGASGFDVYIDDVIAYDITDAKAAQDSSNANSTAIDALKTTVNQQGDTITAQGQKLTQLDSSLNTLKNDVDTKATAKSVTDLTSRVTSAEGKITSQGTAITGLQNGLKSTDAAVAQKADASALNALSNTVTQNGKDISSQGTAITSLNNSVKTAQTTADGAAAAAGKAQTSSDANAASIKTLQNDVKTVGDKTTSNSSDITSLQNNVNSIMDAKENMVNNYDFRNGLDQWRTAGSPLPSWSATDGESGTPAVTMAKTGASNPELHVNNMIYWPIPVNARVRINVRGKGVDGAKNVMCRLYIKSNSGAVKTIDRVMTFGDDWSTQTYDYASVGADAATIGMRLYAYPAASTVVISSVTMFDVTDAIIGAANSSAISDLQTVTTSQGKDITSQGSAITKLQGDVAQNTKDISTKADGTALTSLGNRVTTAEGKISTQGDAITKLTNSLSSTDAKVATKADASALSSLQTTVTAQGKDVASQGTAITSLQNDLKTANETLAGKANSSSVSALDNRVTATESAITSQGSSITNLSADMSTVKRTGNNPWIDGSFESYADGRAIQTTGTAALVTTAMSNSGSKCLRIYRGAGATNNQDRYIGDAITVRGGASYYVECWAYMPSTETPSDGWSVGVGVHSITPAGGNGWHGAVTITEATLGARDKWVKFSGYAKLAAGASSANIWTACRGSNGAGTPGYNIYIDDLVIQEVTDAVAAQVSADAAGTAVASLTTRVTAAEGTITTQGQQITALNNSVAGKADSSAVNSLTNRVTTAEGKITAQGTAITSINNALNDKASSSALSSLSSKVDQQGTTITAQGTAVTQLTSRVGNAEASLNSMFESIATAALAQNNGFTAHRAQLADNAAQITETRNTMATQNSAMAEKIDTVDARVGTLSATVQETATAAADANGKISAMWGVKVTTNNDGVSHVGGIQLGVDSEGSSQFLVDAETFGVYNQNASGSRVLAFSNNGGNTYLRSAMIQDASIDAAKIKAATIGTGQITDYLQSTDYVANSKGMRIGFKSGEFEMNGTGGGGRMQITNDRIISYNEDGSVAAVFGRKL